MSASAQPGLPPRKVAGGFEQRMAKGPDGERTIHLYLCNFKLFFLLMCCISLFPEADSQAVCALPASRGFKGVGRGGGGAQSMIGGTGANNNGAHVSPQVQLYAALYDRVSLPLPDSSERFVRC